MSTSSRTAIVIPTWNNSKCLSMALSSLFHMTDDKNFHVIVVDNGSGTETAKCLKDYDVQVVRLEKNEGFVRGTNAGLAEVEPDDDVCLMNDDVCIVDPDWLTKLRMHLTGDVGAVGPSTNYAIGAQAMWSAKRFPLVHKVPWLTGFCMLVSAEAFLKVGMLDEAFGMGGSDDLDYSIRIRRAGYRMLVVHEAFVFHWGSVTMNKIQGYDEAIVNTNRNTLLGKWGAAALEELGRVEL